ncbi:MAG: flagellar brake protein [Gammaproteobacteria bacterium]|nr:flagellar brake protein [Gammaproteobacteria bacterium]
MLKQEPVTDNTFEIERITEAARIAGLFNAILETRDQFTVQLHNRDDLFNSMILSVNADGKTLDLDELQPLAANNFVDKGVTLRMMIRFRGAQLAFSTTVINKGRKNGAISYRCSLPPFLLSRQMRNHYRVEVGVTRNILVILADETGATIQGTLHDISIGGIGIRVNATEVQDVKTGERLARCTLHVDDTKTISSPLEIKFKKNIANTSLALIGGSFIDLQPRDKNRLSHFVAALDRENQKRLHRV